MMFCSLLILLVPKLNQLLAFSSRPPIYTRVYKEYIDKHKLSIFTRDDFNSCKLLSSSFDYQSPIGSICQYRFTDLESYSPRVPCLTADSRQSANLSKRYFPNGRPSKVIGISWRGGGKGLRIKQKSISEDMFFGLLKSLGDVTFINLQYGKYKKLMSTWSERGLQIIDDPSVNPLENMDLWLSQVSLCDAVISVANTTIHGAGGLNIPTMCLLSRHSDWRWFDDPTVLRSYWYPSVGIAREDKTSGWAIALHQVQNWVSEGCSFPVGPISS